MVQGVQAQEIFQSTLPQGERRGRKMCAVSLMYFNPRSRKGSDLDGYGELIDTIQFQSTLPQGERQGTGEPLKQCSIFQSTLPQGERQQLSTKKIHITKLFCISIQISTF